MADSAVAADAREWVRDAFLDSNLAADVLRSFSRRSRVDLEAAEGDERPSTSAPPPPPVELLGWGRRIRRSSMMRLPRIFAAARREEEEEVVEMEDAAAAATTEKRKGKRRASPQSPLEGYSSASASGDEEGARAERSTGVSDAAPVECHAKLLPQVVVTTTQAPSLPPIAIRRPSSKKMTKLELQSVERTLLEEKTNILKELERWRRAVDELRSNNVKLQAHRESARKPYGFNTVIEDSLLPAKCQPAAPSSLPGRRDFIAIPDLNDPISDCCLSTN